MEHSIQCITISWHSLVWFMDVHLTSYTIIMMMAILFSIFMNIAFKKLLTAPNGELSWSSPAFRLRAPVQGLSFFADLPSFTGCSISWIKMSRLCHTATCHVCPQTIPLILHGRQLPWCHINISDGLLSERLDGGFFACLVTEQLLRVLLPSILRPCAAERSCAHGFFICTWAAFQGNEERLVRCCVAMYLYSDYHPYGLDTGWPNSMSTLNQGKFTTSLDLFLKRKTGKSEPQIGRRKD